VLFGLSRMIIVCLLVCLYLQPRQATLAWKLQYGALRIASISTSRRRLRGAGRLAFERWRDLALGTFELVPRHTFMQAIREKQARIADLEVWVAPNATGCSTLMGHSIVLHHSVLMRAVLGRPNCPS